jgi:hypothetical protein
MPLPFLEKLAMLMPPSFFYRRRIAEEARSGEPELAVLAKLVPRGGTAIDIGASRGVYAYALSDIADRVVAFDPNPDYASFARCMLRGQRRSPPGSTLRRVPPRDFLRAAFRERNGPPPRRAA